MDTDELQAALDAATATLARFKSSSADMWAVRHARDVLALVACVSALRDVLAQTERERDEARAAYTTLGDALVRYERAIAARHAVEARFCFGTPPPDKLAWRAERDAADAECDAAYDALRAKVLGSTLAALRETPAGEGGR